MVKLCLDAAQADEETILDEALIEMNEMADVEPKFFRKIFKEVSEALVPLVAKNDYTNTSIRH